MRTGKTKQDILFSPKLELKYGHSTFQAVDNHSLCTTLE